MKIIIILYAVLYLNIVVHELLHFAAAKLFDVKTEKIAIGSEALSLKINKFSISPLPGGYVDVDYGSLMSKNTIQILLFYEAGTMGNILITLFMHVFFRGLIGFTAAFVGIIMVIANNLIFIPNTDGSAAIQLLLNRLGKL